MEGKQNSKGNKPRRRRLLKIFLSIFIVLLLIRLVLPYVVLHFANKTLAGMHGYYGHVEDIDIALIRGAYQLNNIYINKVDTNTQMQTAFFRVQTIDLSLEWKALFHGSIVGELVFDRPMLRFTKDKTEPNQVKKDSSDFRAVLDQFMPLKINRFEVNDGIIAYHDSSSKPVVSLEMTNTHILAQNLRNAYDSSEVLPATVDATAYLYKGNLNFKMKINPLADDPTFDINMELTNTNLPELNEFFKAYGKFDVHRGSFGLYSEMAAKDNKFTGYVKPVITDLDIVGPEDKNDGFLHKLWERMVGAAGVILRNQRKNQLATKIPIEGSFNAPDANVVDALVEVVINAFIRALIPAIDNDINLRSVDMKTVDNRNFLQKIFQKKDKEQKKETNTVKKKK
jgi:hypothetical protein